MYLEPYQKTNSLEVTAQKLIHHTNSMLFSQPRFTPHFLFFVLETLLCFLLCFINCEHAATTQRVRIFFLCVFLLLPILFTSRCLFLLYLEFLLKFLGFSPFNKICLIYFNESPSKMMKKLFISSEKLFSLSRFLNVCLDSLVM